MLNNKIYPFERNRYYTGKLLTTSDFEAEQKYFNNKRRFLNKVIFGSGRVCGLKVYAVGENAIMLESGLALDDNGREIVVEEAGIRKLASIDGFDKIRADKMVLCIEYAENPVQPIYVVTKNDDGKDYEYNRIDESYRLFLKEWVDVEKNENIEDKLIHNKEIYADENYRVIIKMPMCASTRSGMKIVTKIEKLSDDKSSLDFKYTINVPGFADENDNEKIMVSVNSDNVTKNHSVEEILWVYPKLINEQDKTNFMIRKEDININLNGKKISVQDNTLFQIDIRENDPIEIIKTKVKSQSLEDSIANDVNKDIELGIITILRSGVGYIIQDVKIPIESKYSSEMPAQVPYIKRIINYYQNTQKECVNEKKIEIVKSDKKDNNLEFARKIEEVISNGTFEIPLGINMKANKTILSDEIMHGLGTGDVCVDVGFEFVTQVAGRKDVFAKKIILGDPAIFKDEGISLPSVSTAVQVLCEKGTFIVGLKFAEVTNIVSVKIRWFAYRKPDITMEKLRNFKEKGIYVKKDTINLVPNEIHFIEIGFKDMNPTALRYEVIDKDGGEIDANGVYTAPSKDGVYEIKISCINEPSIYTFAYAIVMKKDDEE